MVKRYFYLFVGIFLIFSSTVFASADYASKEKGWHKGAYTLLGVGFLNVDKDVNVVTGQSFGSDIIPAYGLTTGWNFLDHWATELQMRYGTEKVNGRREHAVNINFNGKYSFILDALTKWKIVRFLPYVKIGAGVFGAAVPNLSAGNDRLGVWGPTFDLGGGMEILIHKFLYVGLDFTQDFAFLQEKFNTINGVRTKILNGGFDPQSSLFGYVGVHF
ncbi:MAG: outer membrane beta-barrel protein [Deltaproteobacteria bacterium]|nr:outer membrane beta-barrel protein [Deltaproteobacteria bacterium]